MEKVKRQAGRKPVNLEDIHRELFCGFQNDEQVSSTNGKRFKQFSVFKPERRSYSATTRMS